MKKIKIYEKESYKKLGDLYGLFFEDINHAADGGLYAELVQNRSFEFCEIDRKEYHALTAWEKSDNTEWEVCTRNPLNEENTHYLHVKAGKDDYVRNLGFNTGIYVETGKTYRFRVYARAEKKVPIRVSIADDAGRVYAKETLSIQGNGWTKYECKLKAVDTTTEGRLMLAFVEDSTCDLDMVSLFPEDTFKGRENGLRKDIAEALGAMKPKFMRFPGGCLTHDGSLNDHDRNSMYRWKRTIGKIEERPSWRNNWGYNQTLGLGYYEYFCFCEDIGAKPLPVLPGGFNPHKGEGTPMEELGVWVQEALDLIEFANGDASTPMGSIRKEMGHEEPFHMEYIGIGNEEIGEGFFERYPHFHQAIREKYPDIKIINTAGPFAVGEGYDDGWSSAKKYGSDLVDEHYYSSPEWFLANMHHYEDYDENGPKVFLGEYASWGNTYYNAIVEAAYMTHLERSKAVALACYAPMLCNVDYVNWKPDMLWFNNHEIVKTPNYYVQKMFMENQGTDAVRFELENLDEIIPLTDNKNIAGKLSIIGNDVEGRIWDIKLTDNTTGEVIQLPELSITTENLEHVLENIDSSDYSLEFHFRRTAGRKGLKIFFGENEKGDRLQWEFGGWDNWDCNLTTIYNGRGSTISHRIFHVEDMEYTLRLEIKERHIKTYVNGVLWNDVTDRLPELEELYVTASTEQDKTILKVVNLTGDAKETEILLEGDRKTKVYITSLHDYALTAENTFEQPQNIVPKESTETYKAEEYKYTFAPHSVTVMVFEA